MVDFNCENCKVDISDYKRRVQILDAVGFTHSYCRECGSDVQKKIEERNKSIKEFGKEGRAW